MLSCRKVLQLFEGNQRFWLERAMNAAAVVSGVFLFNSPVFSLKLVSLVIFMITGPLGVSSYLVEAFVEPTIFTLRWSHKGTPVKDPDFIWLSKVSGIRSRKKTVNLIGGLDNAFSNKIRRTVSFGDKLYNRLSRMAQMVVYAHELGHLASRTMTAYAFLLIAVVTSDGFIMSLSGMPLQVIIVIELSLLAWVTVSISWEDEFRADDYACDILGPRAVIAGLLEVSDVDSRGLLSISHPSMDRRIRRIRKKWHLPEEDTGRT